MMPVTVIYEPEILDEIAWIFGHPEESLPGELEALQKIEEQYHDPVGLEHFQLVRADVPEDERPDGELPGVVNLFGVDYRVSYYDITEDA
jgi:hypothetical protein